LGEKKSSKYLKFNTPGVTLLDVEQNSISLFINHMLYLQSPENFIVYHFDKKLNKLLIINDNFTSNGGTLLAG
jgi:hypothetical protein